MTDSPDTQARARSGVMVAARERPRAETRHYIGAGYYLLIGKCVEMGCDGWPDDEGVHLEHMRPDDAHAMVKAFASVVERQTAAPRAPNEAMLNAARDWSLGFIGTPVGNKAATGCWQAMWDASPAAQVPA